MEISIRQMTQTDFDTGSELLGFEDANAEFIAAFRKRGNFYSIWNGNELTGVAEVEEGKNAWLCIYIDKHFRTRGVGGEALGLCEQILHNAGANKVQTSYRSDSDASKTFAIKHGYKRRFSSVYMEYKASH